MGTQVKIRDIEQLLGSLNTCYPALANSLVYLKRLEGAKYPELLSNLSPS